MPDSSTKHYNVKKHIQPTQHIRQYRRATRKSSSLWAPKLRIVFKQYTPKTNPHPRPGDVTIVAAHANGVSKELYEPMFDDLYERLQRQGKERLRIRAIWIADVAWQGESSVLNESILGNDRTVYLLHTNIPSSSIYEQVVLTFCSLLVRSPARPPPLHQQLPPATTTTPLRPGSQHGWQQRSQPRSVTSKSICGPHPYRSCYPKSALTTRQCLPCLHVDLSKRYMAQRRGGG